MPSAWCSRSLDLCERVTKSWFAGSVRWPLEEGKFLWIDANGSIWEYLLVSMYFFDEMEGREKKGKSNGN